MPESFDTFVEYWRVSTRKCTGSRQMAINSDLRPVSQQIVKFSANNEVIQSESGSVICNNGERDKYANATNSDQFSSVNMSQKENQNFSNVDPNLSADSENKSRHCSSSITIPAYSPSSHLVTQKTDAATMTDKEIHDTDGSASTERECKSVTSYSVQAILPSSVNWSSISGSPASAVAAYLSRIPTPSLPLMLHQHFLKFASIENVENNVKSEETVSKKKKKRKYKKKPYIPRPPRPKPGEVRLTTALDGSTLYCCPECHMAYPERELLEQHLVIHRLERRFVCDICGAGLKRKEHLDRHKQGHNPDRPYACSVCMKAFKRNEHLARHLISHSGDKTQVCPECGKGFYRKDHLRKHTQSHIAKRLRAELVGEKNDSDSTPLGHNIVSLSPLIPVSGLPTPAGVTAVALMPGGTTLPILSS